MDIWIHSYTMLCVCVRELWVFVPTTTTETAGVETVDGTRSAKVEIYERQSSCHQRQEKSLAGHEEQQVQRSSE